MKKQEFKIEVVFASQPDEIRTVLSKLVAQRKKK